MAEIINPRIDEVKTLLNAAKEYGLEITEDLYCRLVHAVYDNAGKDLSAMLTPLLEKYASMMEV